MFELRLARDPSQKGVGLMAAIAQNSKKLAVAGFGALAFSVAALTFGAGAASADPNDPSLVEVGATEW